MESGYCTAVSADFIEQRRREPAPRSRSGVRVLCSLGHPWVFLHSPLAVMTLAGVL